MYKLVTDNYINGTKVSDSNVIQRLSDMACIPMDENNSDYKNYLKWLAEGNTPEPADEPPSVGE